MKIFCTSPFNINKPQQSFKGKKSENKIIQFPPEYVQKENQEEKPLDPEAFQAMYGVEKKPCGLAILEESDDEPISVDIAPRHISNLFSYSDGSLNPKAIKQFSEIYLQLQDEMYIKNQAELEYYENAAKKKAKIIEWNTSDEDYEQTLKNEFDKSDWLDGDFTDYYRNVISKVSGKLKEDILDAFIQINDQEKAQIPIDAYDLALRIMQLSKAGDEFDLSNYDETKKTVEIINEMGFNCYPDYYDDDLYDEILNVARDEKGKPDLKLMQNMAKVMSSALLKCSPTTAIGITKTIINLDKENEDKIVDTMKQLNRTVFCMDDEIPNFQDLILLCFDENGKFNEKNASIVTSFSSLFSDILQDITLSDEGSGKETRARKLFYNTTVAKNLIINNFDYFNHLYKTDVVTREQVEEDYGYSFNYMFEN